MTDPLYIEAPYPAPAVTVVIPQPKLDNTTGLTSSIITHYSEDGTLYTYVKKRGDKKKYMWSFNISKDKSDELANFFRAYAGERVKIEWGDNSYIGYFLTNPNELRAVERAGNWPGGELVQITLEFQESSL